MEGWDGTADGQPTDLTRRRWQRFGESGAKLIWGGEAVAVRHDGRANPNQLVIAEPTLGRPRRAARAPRRRAPRARSAPTDDLVVGLQLTHSGRYARPDHGGPGSRASPTATRSSTRASASPTTAACFTDDELDALVDDFVARRSARRSGRLRLRRHQALPRLPRARAAQRARTARAGTAAASRTARASCARSSTGIRAEAPGPARSACACRPSTSCRSARAPTDVGVPEADDAGYRLAFGFTRGRRAPAPSTTPTSCSRALERIGHPLGLPHRGQPVLQPAHPAAGALPAVRRLPAARGSRSSASRGRSQATAALKARHPGLAHRRVGLQLPAGVAAARGAARSSARAGRRRSASAAWCSATRSCRPTCSPAVRSSAKLLCRTFSDCTTAPRNGLVSGCYPLDPFYAAAPGRGAAEAASRKKAP